MDAYTVNNGSFTIENTGGWRTLLIQQRYPAADPRIYTVQRPNNSNQFVIYVRKPDGSNPADGTTVRCSILGVK